MDSSRIRSCNSWAVQAVRKPDFAVTPDGVAAPLSKNRMREGFEKAGFPARASTKTVEKGIIYQAPPIQGLEVRMMEGSKSHPKRVVFSTPGTGSPRTPSGKTPKGTKENQRAQSHVEQEK